MNSLILRTATNFLLPLLILFSVFLLFRGHNQPGGGFVAGLTASGGFILFAIAYDAVSLRKIIPFRGIPFVGTGLLLVGGSGLVSLIQGKPFLTGQWFSLEIPSLGKLDLGTPLLFDIGVYLVVMGVVLVILLSLMEE